MRTHLLRGGLITVIALLLSTAVWAQDTIHSIYDQGSLSFDYQQWPWGSYSGSFSAEGSLLDSLLWGNEQVESCGGMLQTADDTTVAMCYGAIHNSDTDVDLAAVFVRGIGELTPGSYPVDTSTFMAGYAFFDGVSNLEVPADSTDLLAWFESLEAEHKFFSSTGSIVVTTVDEFGFAGSFSGTALDPEAMMIIEVSGGAFALSGSPVTAVAETPTAITIHAAAHPNPFNPRTRIVLSLDRAQSLELAVYDLRGRLVDRLFAGQLDAGEHTFDWEAGEDLSAGLYLYRVESAGASLGGKLVLLP